MEDFNSYHPLREIHRDSDETHLHTNAQRHTQPCAQSFTCTPTTKTIKYWKTKSDVEDIAQRDARRGYLTPHRSLRIWNFLCTSAKPRNIVPCYTKSGRRVLLPWLRWICTAVIHKCFNTGLCCLSWRPKIITYTNGQKRTNHRRRTYSI